MTFILASPGLPPPTYLFFCNQRKKTNPNKPTQSKVWRPKWPHVRTNSHLSVLRNGQYVLPNINWRNERFLCPRCKHPVSPESTDVSICPGRPPIAHTQIPSQYTHIDLAIDPRCQDDVHYLQVAVLLLCYFHLTSPQGANYKKAKKRELPDSHLAWRIMSVTK